MSSFVLRLSRQIYVINCHIVCHSFISLPIVEAHHEKNCFTLCMLLMSVDIFSKYFFSKNSFRNNTIRVANSLDSGQIRQNIGPDLNPICLQRLSALRWHEQNADESAHHNCHYLARDCNERTLVKSV